MPTILPSINAKKSIKHYSLVTICDAHETFNLHPPALTVTQATSLAAVII